MSPRLALYLLGPPRLYLDNEPILVERRKVVALLAYLAIERGQHRRESLSALLWPDYDQPKAFTNLRHALWEIQQSIGEDWLSTDREKIGLNEHGDIWLDVGQFESLLTQSRAQNDVPLRIPLLVESTKLYRNHFMTGFSLKDAPNFNEWAFAESEDLRCDLAGALTSLSEDYCALGQADQAIPYARRLIMLDPLNESAHRRLMEVYLQAGQHSAALKQYQTCEKILRNELGVDPQPETYALYKQIRKRELKPGLTVKSAGRPVQKHNLPLYLTTFVGREKEIADVIRLVEKARMVSLIGAGGVGKTRLSLESATKSLSNYNDGVWLVELAPILDPTLVPRTTAMAVGLHGELQHPIIDRLCEYLREKHMLIMLDDCEHLVDACAQMADRILHAARNVRILATSREALGIAGEVTYYVPSLGLPDIQHLPSVESLSQCEAVQLFIDRATSAVPTFTMTNENAASLAQICYRLDGIPLAIELAAAKVRVLSVEQIAKRLDDRFHLLTGGSRTALERHQTLRAAIDWSYNLLSPAEQALFRRLSVFVGGWTLEAAESVCGEEPTSSLVQSVDVLKLIERLINKSLVGKEEIQSETRYHMLETMRQYADEKLVESGEGDALREHHLDYFLNLAEKAEPHLIHLEQLEWLEQLESEHENLRFALEYAMNKQRPEYALRLCIALGEFWRLHSYWTEGAKWLESALAKQTINMTEAERTIRVRALCRDAELAQELDNLERMQVSANASLALCETGINPCDFATAKFYVGYSFFRHSDYVHAHLLVEESLAVFRELKNLYWETNAQLLLAKILIATGEKGYGKWIAQDLELSRKSGERLLIAELLYFQAYRSWLCDQFDEAEAYLKEADFLYNQVGYKGSTRSTLLQGWIAQIRNDHEQARAIYHRLIDQCELIGPIWIKASAIEYLGMIAREEGNLKQALAHTQESFQISKEFGFKTVGDIRQALLAQVEYLLGDIENSKRNFKESLSTAKVLNNLDSKTNTLFAFANTLLNRNTRCSVQIIGALDSYFTNKLKEPIDPLLRRETNANIAQARRCLDELTFDTVWTEGEKMSLDGALDLALKIVEEI